MTAVLAGLSLIAGVWVVIQVREARAQMEHERRERAAWQDQRNGTAE